MPPEQQLTLGLPPPLVTGDAPLVPALMINEWVYCRRFAYLEWVEGEWADSADTAEGRRAHARVDEGGGQLPSPEDLAEDLARAKSVTMSSERLGIIAKMDVVEADEESVTPVDFKKGKRPHVAAGAYEPERVQVCAPGPDPGGQRVHDKFVIWGSWGGDKAFPEVVESVGED